MIPKTIHYLWLSDEKPDNVIACIDSWKQHLKDYEIIEWNKTNFPYNDFLWTQEAFAAKKWAFVTDFFRLWVLKKYGGIYLDADITVRNNFDNFLDHKLFIGTEWQVQLGPHVIGAEKGHRFIEKCLDYYDNRHFTTIENNDKTPIMPHIMTRILMCEYNYDGKFVDLGKIPMQIDDITIYDDTYFTANVYDGQNICYHNCFGSWRENPNSKTPLNKFIEHYFQLKFFTQDMYQKKGIAKYIIPFLPCFLISIYFNWKMKIRNNKKVKLVKL